MRTVNKTIDKLEQLLIGDESHIAQLRARQIATLQALDLAQVPMMDGARNLAEWAASRMDLTAETARRLVETARRLIDQPDLAQELEEGTVSFERVVEESRLVASGAEPDFVARSRGWDLAGLRRMTTRQVRISRRHEQRLFGERFLSIQPTLDQTSYKVWGQFPGSDGRIIEQALTHRADQFPPLPDGRRCPQAQGRADALVSIAQDSLHGSHPEGPPAASLVSIFVDAHEAARSNGETGAAIDVGPRVGPLTLEEILCDGRVEILLTGRDGTPLTVGPTARTIPPKLRRFIVHRDGGACTADGCQSRYRLQPHHIEPRSQGGTHHPDNLTTLCNRSSFLRRCQLGQQGRRKVERASTTMWSSTVTASGSTRTALRNDDDSSNPTTTTRPDPRLVQKLRTQAPDPKLNYCRLDPEPNVTHHARRDARRCLAGIQISGELAPIA